LNEHKSEWMQTLRENGYRLTDAREAVVEVVAGSDRVLKPFEVFEIARVNYSKLGLVSVYRTLEKLEELGMIQRVHQPEGCQAFVATKEGHHHLLLCRVCGRYEYFEGENLELFFQEIGVEKQYQIEEHWMQVFGVCSRCQAEANT